MRKFSLLFIALLICGMGFSRATFDNPTNTNTNDIPIKPIGKEITSTKPLSLVSDIEASYYDGALTLVFNADLGDAEILVVNLATGDSWNDGVSGAGVATLLLSGEEGYYEILIHTDNGDYSGEFIL